MEHDDMPPLEEEEQQKIKASNTNGSDYSDDDDDNDSDEEMHCDGEPTTCLFCAQVSGSVETAMEHVAKEHTVNFWQLKQKHQLDQYGFIKLINCIRADGITAQQVTEAPVAFWNDEKYLKPKSYEPWLTYDYDELPRDSENAAPSAGNNEIDVLREQLQTQALLLKQATEDMATMRLAYKRLIEKDATTTTTSNTKSDGEAKPANCVSEASLQADEGYFSSYAHFGIHHEMLSDVVRTTTYRDALLKNADFVRGKDVLDVGCGTSVLSIFAAQAGAKTVVGIDNSDIIYDAMDIVKKNNVDNITLVKGRLEDVELPQPKFDIIISEWMGYFLLFEGMLDSVIYARDKHLREGGMLLPNRCTMSLLGYGSDALFSNHVTFWSDVYGLDMSNMRKKVMHEPLIDIVDAEHILTEPNTIADLNLATVDLNYSNFSYNFELKCTKAGNLSAFVGYFDTFFDLPQAIMFGTAPTDKPTHWKQVVFFMDEPQAIRAGDVVSGKLVCRRSRSSARSLDITIEAFGKKYTYYLD